MQTKNVCVRLNVEFILCESTADNQQFNLLTSKLHSVNNVSCSVLQTSYKKTPTHSLSQTCVPMQNNKLQPNITSVIQAAKQPVLNSIYNTERKSRENRNSNVNNCGITLWP